jgi:hypothetical protein
MTDYRKMPLGPLESGLIGEVIACPNCGEKGREIEDYLNSSSNNPEKGTFCLHFIEPVPHNEIRNDRIVTSIEFVEHKCQISK